MGSCSRHMLSGLRAYPRPGRSCLLYLLICTLGNSVSLAAADGDIQLANQIAAGDEAEKQGEACTAKVDNPSVLRTMSLVQSNVQTKREQRELVELHELGDARLKPESGLERSQRVAKGGDPTPAAATQERHSASRAWYARLFQEGRQLCGRAARAGTTSLIEAADGSGATTAIVVLAVLVLVVSLLGMGLIIFARGQHPHRLLNGQSASARPGRPPPYDNITSVKRNKPAPKAACSVRAPNPVSASPSPSPSALNVPAPPELPRDEDAFCQELVVPPGCECILMVPSRPLGQGTFNVTDTSGIAVLSVEPRHEPSGSTTSLGGKVLVTSRELQRFVLKTKYGDLLAQCGRVPDKPDVHEFHLLRGGGDYYARLTLNEGGRHQHVLVTRAGVRLNFHGSMRDHAIDVTDDSGGFFATTEVQNLHSYKLRVAPLVDVGLVLCGLLCIGHLKQSPA
mmetsp:Transcript_106628/g.301599  ORF Transcript_106628/g.301599 Transcript_106628/m.301599 type:complete len:454 (+) Transcript_106628:124-1485(+)